MADTSQCKIAQKWGFGMAPLLPKTEDRYRRAIIQMTSFLELQIPVTSRIEPGIISEMKGLINRCIRQDQWDWFTVYSRFGEPDPRHLRMIAALLPGLRSAMMLNQLNSIASLQEQLNRTALLTCCLSFLGRSIGQSSPLNDKCRYIYVLSTREYPDLLKIGFTTRRVQDRVKEINSSTGVVFPFSVRRVLRVKDAYQAEQILFSTLNDYRIRSDREFFKVDYYVAIQEIESCLASKNLLNRCLGQVIWYSTQLGYGFASIINNSDSSVFIHCSQINTDDQFTFEPGTVIEFEVCSGAKGLFALCVTKSPSI